MGVGEGGGVKPFLWVCLSEEVLFFQDVVLTLLSQTAAGDWKGLPSCKCDLLEVWGLIVIRAALLRHLSHYLTKLAKPRAFGFKEFSPLSLLILSFLKMVWEYLHWPSPVLGVELAVSEGGLSQLFYCLWQKGGSGRYQSCPLTQPFTCILLVATQTVPHRCCPTMTNFLAFNLKMQLSKLCQVPAFLVYENLESIFFLGRGVGNLLGISGRWKTGRGLVGIEDLNNLIGVPWFQNQD